MPSLLNTRPLCPTCGKPQSIIDTRTIAGKKTRWLGCRACNYRNPKQYRERNEVVPTGVVIAHLPIASDGNNSSSELNERIEAMLQKPFDREGIRDRYGIDDATLNAWIDEGRFPEAAIQEPGVERWTAVQIVSFEQYSAGMPVTLMPASGVPRIVGGYPNGNRTVSNR